jgi:uncharacterized protein YbjT (DUF2867 family)
MISRKMLSPLFLGAALVALPAWSADRDVGTVAPADATAQKDKPNRVTAEVAPPPARYEQRSDRYAPRTGRRVWNPANPLGATSKVNPLEPSPG